MNRKLFQTHTHTHACCDSNKARKKRRKRLVLIYSSLDEVEEKEDVIEYEYAVAEG